MRVGGGPNIVEDGLVLHLDAANQRSFRGEPTENLAYNSNGTRDFDISGLSGSDINLEEISPIVYKITSGTNSGDFSSFRMKFNLSKLENGKTYTLSYNYRIISGGSLFRMTDWCDISNFISKIDKDYTNYSFSSATSTRSTYDNTFRFMDFRIDNNTVVEIWNIQLEQKPYPTPFVNGTRGTTFETGGGWVDVSNNSNHGELVNGVQYDTSNRGTLIFDGVNDYISFSDAPNLLFLDRTPYTLEAWFYITTNPSNYSGIFNRENSFEENRDGYNLWIHPISSEIIRLSSERFQNGTNRGVSVDLSSNSIFNSWQHVCVTYDGSNLRLYYNTDLVSSNSNASGNLVNNSKTLEIGRRNSGGYFNGRLSEQKIYNRALSPEEIKQNFNATKWRFGL